MQTQISTTDTSLLGSGLLFETNPPGSTGPIDPPDNTGGGETTPPQPSPTEEETSSESE